MKIRIVRLSILLGTLGVLIMQSCKKYPEGPAFSLKAREERVANTWKVDNYKINGNDYTSFVADYTETYSKDRNYFYSWGILNGLGTWEFQENSTEIKLSGNDNHSSRTLIILKLEEKVFWYYYMDGNDKHELHLVGN